MTRNRQTRKERKEELKQYLERVLDSEGNAVVDVDLSGDTPRYDALSMKGQRDLNGEIYEYIDAQTNIIPAAIPLRVRIHGAFNEEEREEVRQMMHRHYTMKSYDISWDLMVNFRKMLILAIFGVIMLGVYLYFAISGEHVFATEIFSIIGSFALWEAADAFLLERPRLRQEHRNNEQNLNERIEFVCEEATEGEEEAEEAPAEAQEPDADGKETEQAADADAARN